MLSGIVSLFLNAKKSIYRLREVLEAQVNLDNSEVCLPVKIEVWNRNRIRPDLCPLIVGRFWHSNCMNYENPISQQIVVFWVIFPIPLESLQSNIWVESYDQNTEMCAESEFESNLKFYPIWSLIRFNLFLDLVELNHII